MSRYLVGIDLGTTNSAVAFVDTRAKPAAGGGVRLHAFPVRQLVAAGETKELPLLPSFLYRPGPHDLPPGATALPWDQSATDVVGAFARTHGAKVPGRLVSSAKSWLCHPGVDRTAPLLPWAAPPEVDRLSPLEASAKYLRHLVEAWNAAPGRKPDEFLQDQPVVLTVPASFDDVARTLTADAAKQAGLNHLTLLEEPQAAFYAWLGTHTPQEAGKLKPGMRCVVVDVGGGTSDFSLIRAVEEGGEFGFVRDAVGDHLLLGGDNMDLALAKAAEAKLPAGRLDAAGFGALVQACREAKEQLLGEKPPAEGVPVTVVGRGRSVVGGTLSVTLTVDDVRAALLDGFFPAVPFDSEPARSARGGLQEMGLPYVADPAITKHLAAFLRQHLPAGVAPDAILFNGGVFTPKALQARVVDVMRGWFAATWTPLVLTSPSLDLAVAWGAAYSGWLRASGGRRIGGGIPRAYYLGVEPGRADDADARPAADPTHHAVLCVVPRQLAEGEEIRIPQPVLDLQIGQPVLFPLFTSTVRGDDKPGDVLTLPPGQLRPLPPLHTVLRGGKRAGVKRVPVTLAAKLTDIGTLELSCVSQEGNRWRLEFNTRDVAGLRTDDDSPDGPTLLDVYPEEKVQAAGDMIRRCYAGETPPAELVRALEAALDATRTEWPTGLCRRLWDFLTDVAEQRTRSPQHLSRWYNLAGFVLRPGFGDPLDRYRVEALWKLLTAPGSPEGGADYWILWRRAAGGLNASLQQLLFTKMKAVLLPGRGRVNRPGANELAEMWRAAAGLERLDARTRLALGDEALRQLGPTHVYWALTRLGARQPLYGPLNSVLHPDTAETWLAKLLEVTLTSETERLGWGFAAAQIARRTGVRGVDVSDDVRAAVATSLRAAKVPAAWPAMVEDVTRDAGDDQSRLFGDSLPIGLRLGS